MRLQPHGHTVLVEPDPAPEQTDSGLILMPQDRDHVATSGVVVAVGKGSKRHAKVRDDTIEACLRWLKAEGEHYYIGYDFDQIQAILRRHKGTASASPSVMVGDRVVFAAEAGLTVNDDGKDYILLEEDQICIVVDEEAERRDAAIMAGHKATRHVGDGFGNSFEPGVV